MQVRNAVTNVRKFLLQSLQGRILIAGILLAVVPAVIIGVTAIKKSDSALKQQVDVKLQAVDTQAASVAQTDLKRYLASLQSSATALAGAQSYGMYDLASPASGPTLKPVLQTAVLTTAHDMTAMAVLNASGVTVATTGGDSVSIAGQPYFKAALNGTASMSDPS